MKLRKKALNKEDNWIKWKTMHKVTLLIYYVKMPPLTFLIKFYCVAYKKK